MPIISFLSGSKQKFIIPVSRIHKLTGRKWFDFDYSKFDPPKPSDHPLLISYFADPSSILEKLEIRYMNDQVGHGLYATKEIPKDTVIGFVSGKLTKLSATEVDFDPKNPTTLIQSGTVSYDDFGNIYIVDSSKKSNHTHYIQHLPSDKMLLELDITEENREMISTGNLSEHTLNHKGFDLTYFCTDRDIKEGELIGCPYQVNTNEIKMHEHDYCFFTKDGKIITYNDLTTAFYFKLIC